MKSISTILSVLAIGLSLTVLILFMGRKEEKPVKTITGNTEKQNASAFRIAYFDIDSLKERYEYYKEALSSAKVKEENVNGQLNALVKKNQQKISEWQQKGNNLSAEENQQIQQEYAQMQQEYQAKRQTLEQELLKQNDDVMNDIKKRIEEYLREYNSSGNYAFIFAYDPNGFMYYRDSAYNITHEIISGLNEAYRKKKSAAK